MDPDSIQTRQELAGALTSMRESAGLSLRRLAAAVDAPLATVGGYFSGQHLPTAAQIPLFRRVLAAIGVVEAAEINRWIAAVGRIRRAPTRRPAAGPGAAPYRGLESFQPEDADWFFGREQSTENLVAQAQSGGLLAVVGASGSGKSSLLRAGLVAALRRPTADRPGWVCTVLTPAQDPLAELRRALTLALEPSRQPGAEPDSRPAVELAAAIDAPLLVVIDQFEELFAGSIDARVRDEFIDAVTQLGDARGPGRLTTVVIGLRADFYADASRDPRLLPILQDRQTLVGSLSRAGLRRAIEEPARRAGLHIEPELVDVLVTELTPRGGGAAHDDGALPLLSHALRQTWLRADGGRLTLADFRASGGIAGAVQQTAEETYDNLDEPARRLAKRLFLRLVNVGADAAVTRRRVGLDQLLAEHPERSVVEHQILDRFVQQRLLTADESSVQLSHEALLSAWDRLAGWIELDRVGLQRHRELRTQAAAWRQADHDEGELLRGGRLAATMEWASGAESVAELDTAETEFLDASLAEERRRLAADRARSRRLRRLVAVAVVLAVLAGVAAVFGITARSQAVAERLAATDARDRALSRQLAINASTLRPTDPALAAQLALVAYRTSPTVEARSALLETSATPTPTRMMGPAGPTLAMANPQGTVMAVSNVEDGSITLYGITDPTRPVQRGTMADSATEQQFAGAFSPDGRYFASGGSAGSVVLWDVHDPDHPVVAGAPIEQPDAAGGVRAIAFARDGAELLAEGRGAFAAHWDISDPTAPVRLPDLPAPGVVQALAASPSGDLVAVGGLGGVELWRAGPDGTTTQVSTVAPEGDRTLALVFSPDGQTLVSGTSDRDLDLWNIADPTAPTKIPVGSGKLSAQINGLTFNPDGSYLAVAASDATAQVWDTSNWTEVVAYPHTGPATAVTFTPDGRTVVTASTDGVARIWPFPGPHLAGVGEPTFNLVFSENADLMIGSDDNQRALRVWNVADRLHPHRTLPDITRPDPSIVFNSAASISPDGRLAAGGSKTGPISLWRLTDGSATYLSTVTELTDGVSSVLFSADSSLLIATGRSNEVAVWDIRDPAQPVLLSSTPVQNQGFFALFNPDHQMFAAADLNGTISLWNSVDPTTPTKLTELSGVGASAYTVAFSPDGRFLAGGGINKTVQIWSLADPAAPTTAIPSLHGPRGEVYWLSYRPDGRQLAAASTDGKVWIWDLTDTSAEVNAVLSLPAGGAYTAAYSADGATLAAAGAVGGVSLWSTDTQAVASDICAAAGQGITQSEWELYLPDQDYTPPCG